MIGCLGIKDEKRVPRVEIYLPQHSFPSTLFITRALPTEVRADRLGEVKRVGEAFSYALEFFPRRKK
jgi:hypothetical protein